MNLDNPIIINPPAFSGPDGKVINPDPLVLQNLKVQYTDVPYQKQYFARIEGIPSPVYLYFGSEYDNNPDITKTKAETKLREILGDDPSRVLRQLFPKTLEEHPYGPGTILSGMIATMGIKVTSNCSCKKHAIEMNEKGPEWCEENINTIIGWLKEESNKRGIPFIETAAKLIVNRAINKSKKLLAQLV